ncbi:MAG TPA: antitoxin VapB family protein [Candidatus Nanoarchaeia archaeon]|nr:antitoxin VapB family protein [Candidatus Nanoarchaeia archaeon]
MANVNITVKKEAYDFLRQLKADDQSFSDVILSFRKKHDVAKFIGVLKEVDWGAREKQMKPILRSIARRSRNIVMVKKRKQTLAKELFGKYPLASKRTTREIKDEMRLGT